MKNLIVLLTGLLSLSCFAQTETTTNETANETMTTENALLTQVFKNKIEKKISLNQNDIESLLGDPNEEGAALKDVLIPQLNEIKGSFQKVKYIKFLNDIFAAIEVYFTDFNNVDKGDGLVSKYQEAEMAFLKLVNSFPEYKPRETTTDNEDKKKVQITYYEDGETPKTETYWEARSDGSFGSKFVKEYSPEGKLEEVTNYVEKGTDKFTYVTEYYGFGKAKRVSTYKNGKPNGMQFKYNEKGSIIKKENYNKDGKLDGLSLIYGKNGRVAWMIKYSAGQRLSANKYREDGNLESSKVYDNDVLVSTNKPEYGEDGKYAGRTFILADGTSTKFDASGEVLGDVTIYQPIWTEEKISKRLNYYATHPVEERNVTELLTQGLIKTLIADAKTSKDVTRIEQLLDGVSSGDFVISGSKKQMIGSLRGKLNTAKETITAKETTLDMSDGKIALLSFIPASRGAPGEKIVNAAIDELVLDMNANNGKLSDEALAVFARSDVMEYMGFFAEGKAVKSIVTGMNKILLPASGKIKADYYDGKEFMDLKVKMYEYYNSMEMLKK